MGRATSIFVKEDIWMTLIFVAQTYCNPGFFKTRAAIPISLIRVYTIQYIRVLTLYVDAVK